MIFNTRLKYTLIFFAKYVEIKRYIYLITLAYTIDKINLWNSSITLLLFVRITDK